MCRSRRELSNEYLLDEIGVDTAENESLEVWGKIQFNIHSPPRCRHDQGVGQALRRRSDGSMRMQVLPRGAVDVRGFVGRVQGQVRRW